MGKVSKKGKADGRSEEQAKPRYFIHSSFAFASIANKQSKLRLFAFELYAGALFGGESLDL